MTALRLLFFALLIWLLWRMVKKAFDASVAEDEQANKPTSRNATEHHQMLQCQYCGLYFPEEEAIRTKQGLFCCEEHAHLQKK